MLPDELVLSILKDLVDVTSFKYMNSIRTVSRSWNGIIIKDILPKSIQSILGNKLLIEYHCDSLSIRGATIIYDSSRFAFRILINNENNDKLKLDITDIPRSQDINENKEGQICVKFHYDNGSYIVLFNFGTLKIHREGNEFPSRVEWNFNDCSCIYERDNNNPDFYTIQVREMTISLSKACVMLDLLNGTEQKSHEFISQKSVYGVNNYKDWSDVIPV
ncbi:hypothetical protein C1645_815686 [Glomus cerebriforme]|uniref:F-box domain-containing protein n=1 Tax=Glomus cerebriforme TaxID=658196 RepID=A0A397TIA6_9GLOM|nr:hypothetical protein C1645_815686 [Glomus cerebriforme]